MADLVGEAPDKSTSTSTARRGRTSNAQRCRKHRQKARELEVALNAENLQLKRERADMLKRLAHLEFLVQALRGQQAVDLTAQNELLRSEIKKHREYIDKVVEVTKKTPLDTAEEERKRLIRNCVEGGIGHVVGLAYSSRSEGDRCLGWSKGVSSWMTLDPESNVQMEVDVAYQFLPLGSTAGTAKRINLRLDYLDFPFEWELVAEFYRTLGRDEGYFKDLLDQINPKYKLQVHRMDTKDIKDEELKSWRFTKWRAGIRRDVAFVSSGKNVELYPNAFSQHMRPEGVGLDEQIEVKAMVSCSCDMDSTTCDTSTAGMLFKDGRVPGHSQFSYFTSQARVNGFWEFAVEEDAFVEDSGVLNRSFHFHLEKHWQHIYAYCKERAPITKDPTL